VKLHLFVERLHLNLIFHRFICEHLRHLRTKKGRRFEPKGEFMSVISEFKKFALRGNVMDMAVGIIIGGAFGTVVKSLVDDVIMPPIGMLTSGIDFKNLAVMIRDADANTKAVTINYGSFINNVISFLIIAWAVFMLVKAMNAAESRLSLGMQPDAPPPPEEVVLLREIRDSLQKT
jgi:large conductance mechanosensitive channel